MSNPDGSIIHGVYLDLDCIMDTRLATLYLIHPSLSKEALENNYNKRQEDAFPKLSREMFRKAYKERRVDTLMQSTTTNVIAFLKPIVKQLIIETVTTPYAKDAKIWLNTYPYKLSADYVNAIGEQLHEELAGQMQIEIVHMAPQYITPLWCKEHMSIMFMYDFEDWLEMHTEAFKKTRISEVQLYVPRLYLKGVPTNEKVTEVTNHIGGPFEQFELAAAILIGLNFLDIEIFSSPLGNLESAPKKYVTREIKD